MCVHNWEYAPPYVVAHDAIEAGRIGKVQFISMDRLRVEPAGASGSGGKWRSSAASGGGILIDHGWHVFYLMQWLLGAASPESISAHLESMPGADVDHHAELRITFAGGQVGIANLSWRSQVRKTTALISGEAGVITIDGDRVYLTDHDTTVQDLTVADAPDDSYHAAWFSRMAEEFERAIDKGSASDICRQNLVEARAALAIILGARESAASGDTEVKLAGLS
jgi:predicted dehydrogenase